MMSTITPRENYLRMLKGEIPEHVPSFFIPYGNFLEDELLTPMSVPNGTFVTSFGVEYTGSKDMNMGAMPTPGKIILPDITEWEKYIKKPDVSGRDWEAYYKVQGSKWDRENHVLTITAGDYFLTAVSFMGFENAMLAMYEEPDALKDMLAYVSEFYIEVMKQEIYYCKPDILIIMDDDSAYRAPFFSVDMYREFFKPLHKKHCDIALESGMMIERHDCGKCEQFIDDWLDLGIRGWNPAQISNDLKTIKKKYAGRLAINGGWDSQGVVSSSLVNPKMLRDTLAEYVDLLAPGGGFVYAAVNMGDPADPATAERTGIIKDFYFDYVKDYYKNH